MRRSRRRRSAAPRSMRCSARISSANWSRARRSASRTTRRCACRRSAAAAPSRCSPTRSTRPGRRRPRAEALSVRRFGAGERYRGAAPLRPRGAGAAAAPARLSPHARAPRRRISTRAARLREAVRHDGDVMQLRRLKRRLRQRRILLLIDVSGSMKERTETHLRIAHALAHAVERIEVFTFGTRLTRVTRAHAAEASRAGARRDLGRSSATGTAARASAMRCRRSSRVPRFAGYARGARGADPLRRAGARRSGGDARRR